MMKFIEKNMPESMKTVLDGARKLLPNRKGLERHEQEYNGRPHNPSL